MPNRTAYLRVLGAAVLCYAALGAVLRIIPHRLGSDLGAGSFLIGLAVGAPAISGVVARPLGGRVADRRGPAPVVLVGAAIMAIGIAPALIADTTAQVTSRLAVGAGEGMMMSATVLWLLRLGGAQHRGRALGHIGLANYPGLAVGPLLADALSGEAHPDRVLAAAVALPLLGAAVSYGAARPPAPPAPDEPHDTRELVRATLRPGLGLMLVNFGY